MTFEDFKAKLQQNFQLMIVGKDALFLTGVEKDQIWDAYLLAFPEAERQDHNCNSCRQFLKPFGNLVAIHNNKIKTIWDFDGCTEPFESVRQSLHNLVISAPIRDKFINTFPKLGTDFNFEETEAGPKRWNHFHLVLPANLVTRISGATTEDSLRGLARDTKNVFKRSLEEITTDSLTTVLDLIAQNSLYRGNESTAVVTDFLKYKKEYELLPADEKDNYAWNHSVRGHQSVTKIRSNAIGTLLVNISEGMELDVAVGKFEAIMAPANYKRPTAIMTKAMIEAAQKQIVDMGFSESLGRRYATVDDITVNNVMFVDRATRVPKGADVFADLAADAKPSSKNLSKVDEITIDDFVKNVLPTINTMEVLMENNHQNNLMSLIAPQVKTAPSMFKWNNGFSWAYNNNVTDSIKERVKAAGGRVEGYMRASLSWFNFDDLDLHIIEPGGKHIYYAQKLSPTSGHLDVDMNAGGGTSRTPVENTIYTDKSRMIEGEYLVYVNQFSKRESKDVGFTIELEYDGQITTINYNKVVSGSVNVARFTYSKTKGITIVPLLPHQFLTQSKEVWGVNTNQFMKVNMMMASPNYWDGQGVGNKHYFFMLDKCINPDQPRGFFNEFLKEDLMAQKRVFEALGDKLKVEPSNTQLSGLGFSSTNRTSLVCKVTGTFTRTLKINF